MKKIVVFDFDGTLSKKGKNIWREMWRSVGADLGPDSLYSQLYKNFIAKRISYNDWCNLTCDYLRYKNFNRKQFFSIVNNYELNEGFYEFIGTLNRAGYKMHIVSGGVHQAICNKLKRGVLFFDSINANSVEFDDNGIICKINATKYDFEGKAQFVKNLILTQNVKPENILFIGNGNNDEWVSRAGCKTLCINPDQTNSNNKDVWHDSIDNVNNLKQLLPKIFNEKFGERNLENVVSK